MMKKTVVVLMAAFFSVSVAGLSFAYQNSGSGYVHKRPAGVAKPSENPVAMKKEGPKKTKKAAKRTAAPKVVEAPAPVAAPAPGK